MTTGESRPPRSLTIHELRRALRLSYLSAGLWAIGNGLVSTTLVIYLAFGQGGSGLAVSLLVAAPHFAGLLRLAVPAVMARLRNRKVFCTATYFASTLILAIVPLAAAPGIQLSGPSAIATLVTAWCIYHLFEYAGTIALWSWLGDLVPSRIRGRFCGHRERWLTMGRIGGIAFTVLLAWLWTQFVPDAERWQPLATSAALGALLMAAAVVPLVLMPAVESMPSAVPKTPWRAVVRATFRPPYSRLVFFSCYWSLVHGITAPVQRIYPWKVLDISYPTMQLLQGMTRLGQTALAPTMGQRCDQWGSRPVMIFSLLVVGVGPLFFIASTPAHWWWLVGAYVVWMAYAGLNVGFDNLKLKLAPPDNTTPYLAVYYALADFVYAATTVATGLLIDGLVVAGQALVPVYTGVLAVGFVGRMLGVPLLMAIDEPSALKLRELRASEEGAS